MNMLLHTIWLAVFSLFVFVVFLISSYIVPRNIAAGSVVISKAAAHDLLIDLHVSSQFE